RSGAARRGPDALRGPGSTGRPPRQTALLRRPEHAPGRRGAWHSLANGGTQLDLCPHLAAPGPRAGGPGQPLLTFFSRNSWRVCPRGVAWSGAHPRRNPMTAPADQAKTIFLHALEIPSSEGRRAYLDVECGGDEVLRREVEDLLGHHGQL